MKKTIITLMVLFAVQTFISAQCGVNHKEILNKYCKGIYLTHKEIKSNKKDSIRFIFNKGTKYAAYFLNPSKDFPIIEISGKDEIPFSSFTSKFYKNENYSEYIFTAKNSGEYFIRADFGTQEDACILLALYFLSNEKKD